MLHTLTCLTSRLSVSNWMLLILKAPRLRRNFGEPQPVAVCQGCCCGNTANGKPPVPVDWLKKEWRARGLLKRVQLTISGCLGPCDLPNVVTISNQSGTPWLGEFTELAQYHAIVDWASRSRDAADLLPLPREFRKHTL
jgi:hypothetical protein